MLEIFKEIRLDKGDTKPLYQQLFEILRDMMLQGRLLRDTRLPSIRIMAQMLGVNQVTVVSAYRKLEEKGYVYSKEGSGTYVADVLRRLTAMSGNALFHDELYQFPFFRGQSRHHDSLSLQDDSYAQSENPYFQNDQIIVGENTINFASATPTPDLFPVDNFKIVLNEVLDRDRGNAFSYHESRGFLPLRESVAELLEKRGMNFPADDINIISGAQQGIDIIAKAFIRQGDYVLTESPTYTGAVAVFKSRSAQLADVAIRPGGPDLNHMEYMIKKCRPKFMYTIPSFQNPTGFSYSEEKRKALLDLSDRYGFYIIEDDYVGDLDFENMHFSPLKSLDANGRVILVKSFSKLFMPGLRLGFMVVPPQLSQDILAAKHTADISTSSLVQRAFDLYIRKGYWRSHFDFMYRIYEERYHRITNALDIHLPDTCGYIKPGGGLNIWIDMPSGFPVGSLLHMAAVNDIAFAPGSIFHTGNTPDAANNLRLSFAAVNTDKIEAGIEKLCSLIGRLSGNRSSAASLPIL